MEIQEALDVVRRLADGLHPENGESLGKDSLYQHPQAVRALSRAVLALEFHRKGNGHAGPCQRMRVSHGRERKTRESAKN